MDKLQVAQPLCPSKHANLPIPNEIDRHHRPGGVRRDSVIKLWREGTERGETRPRDRGEVVVLVVITNLGMSLIQPNKSEEKKERKTCIVSQ